MQEIFWQELDEISKKAFPQDNGLFDGIVALNPLLQEKNVSMQWLEKNILPAIVLLPAYITGSDKEKQKQLATVFQQFYLAHGVHCAILPQAKGKESAFPILSGDLLYALFYQRLYEAGLSEFNKTIAEAICSVNEGALQRQNYFAGGANAIKEGVAFLEKEYGNLFATAAGCAGELAKLNTRFLSAYKNIAMSLGILLGQKKYYVASVQDKQEIRANYYLKQLSGKEEWLTLSYFLNKILDKKDYSSFLAVIPKDLAL